MTKGEKILEKIKEYFAEARKKYPEITDEMLCDNGAIYYMNGNDGTNFDWQINDRLCEFFLFYKETEYGFIKVYVSKYDTIYGYLYLGLGMEQAIHLEEKSLAIGDAEFLKNLLMQEADCKHLYDKSVTEIDFSSHIR